MLKIYIALFWQKNPRRQAEYDALNGHYMNKRTAFALCAAMVWIPILGMFPGILEGVSRMCSGFTGIEGVHGIHFFSFANLRGGAISLAIGTFLYLTVVRKLLYKKERGYIAVQPKLNLRESAVAKFGLRCVDGLCAVVDHALENRIFLHAVPEAVSGFAENVLDRFVENPFIMKVVPDAATALTRAAAGLTDGVVVLLKGGLFRSRSEHRHRKHSVYYAFSNVMGRILNAFVLLLNLTLYRNRPIHIDFVYVLASRVYDRDPEFARATRTVSFGLLLFAAGLLLALVYLIVL